MDVSLIKHLFSKETNKRFEAFMNPLFGQRVNDFLDKGANPTNVTIGFIDGSGGDTIPDHDLDSPRTWVYVIAPAPALWAPVARAKNTFPGFSLRKWTGRDPLKKNDHPSSQKRGEYWRTFGSFLLSDRAPTMSINVLRLTLRDMFSCSKELLGYVGLHFAERADGYGYVHYTNPKFSRMIHIFDPDNSHFREVRILESSALVLSALACMIGGVVQDIQEVTDKVLGSLILTDPLMGDPVHKDGLAGNLLGMMLRYLVPGRTSIRFMAEQDASVGELFADNLAGIFHKGLDNDPLCAEIVAGLMQSPRARVTILNTKDIKKPPAEARGIKARNQGAAL